MYVKWLETAMEMLLNLLMTICALQLRDKTILSNGLKLKEYEHIVIGFRAGICQWFQIKMGQKWIEQYL